MKRHLQVIIIVFALCAFGLLSRLSFIWELALIVYEISIVIMVWMVIKLLRKPDSSDRSFDRYFFDDLNLRKNRKNG